MNHSARPKATQLQQHPPPYVPARAPCRSRQGLSLQGGQQLAGKGRHPWWSENAQSRTFAREGPAAARATPGKARLQQPASALGRWRSPHGAPPPGAACSREGCQRSEARSADRAPAVNPGLNRSRDQPLVGEPASRGTTPLPSQTCESGGADAGQNQLVPAPATPGWERGPERPGGNSPVLRHGHRPETPSKSEEPAGVLEDTGQAAD